MKYDIYLSDLGLGEQLYFTLTRFMPVPVVGEQCRILDESRLSFLAEFDNGNFQHEVEEKVTDMGPLFELHAKKGRILATRAFGGPIKEHFVPFIPGLRFPLVIVTNNGKES